MRLKDKSAIVTGAASGIGEQIARAFAAEGARVCVADLERSGAERVAASLGASAIALGMDVTDEDAVERGVTEAAQRFGGIDILVSNAGLQHVEPIAELDYADWKRILAVHLDGGFLTTRACLRRMIERRRGGALILMGSVHSKEASVHKGPYVAAKHGLLGLARVLAKEGAPHGVRANVICPGFVLTPLVERQIPQLAKERGISEAAVVKDVMLATTVDGEFTSVADVAEVALFLAAFPSNALTGQSIVVSHGWHMQ
ncbi:MAG: 3-hydroxybutyrate dehydrogenase [Betaproteobacteria bacterium]|nr:MAG: 3-hydroxybutyrate dehydrogenase [Betaproteobacteria bacterium]